MTYAQHKKEGPMKQKMGKGQRAMESTGADYNYIRELMHEKGGGYHQMSQQNRDLGKGGETGIGGGGYMPLSDLCMPCKEGYGQMSAVREYPKK